MKVWVSSGVAGQCGAVHPFGKGPEYEVECDKCKALMKRYNVIFIPYEPNTSAKCDPADVQLHGQIKSIRKALLEAASIVAESPRLRLRLPSEEEMEEAKGKRRRYRFTEVIQNGLPCWGRRHDDALQRCLGVQPVSSVRSIFFIGCIFCNTCSRYIDMCTSSLLIGKKDGYGFTCS